MKGLIRFTQESPSWSFHGGSTCWETWSRLHHRMGDSQASARGDPLPTSKGRSPSRAGTPTPGPFNPLQVEQGPREGPVPAYGAQGDPPGRRPSHREKTRTRLEDSLSRPPTPPPPAAASVPAHRGSAGPVRAPSRASCRGSLRRGGSRCASRRSRRPSRPGPGGGSSGPPGNSPRRSR
jgi:hypothetical protein